MEKQEQEIGMGETACFQVRSHSSIATLSRCYLVIVATLLPCYLAIFLYLLVPCVSSLHAQHLMGAHVLKGAFSTDAFISF